VREGERRINNIEATMFKFELLARRGGGLGPGAGSVGAGERGINNIEATMFKFDLSLRRGGGEGAEWGNGEGRMGGVGAAGAGVGNFGHSVTSGKKESTRVQGWREKIAVWR
jgi:hypothetical protein